MNDAPMRSNLDRDNDSALHAWRIESLKRAIQAGTYHLDALLIADAMMQAALEA